MRNLVINTLLQHPFLQYTAHNAYAHFKLCRNFFFRPKIRTEEKFLFVVGCGRSGNTLLRRLLVEKLQVYIPAETYVLGSTLSVFMRSKHLKWVEQVRLVLSAFEYHPEFGTISQTSLAEVAKRCCALPASDQTYGNIIISLYGYFAEQCGCSCVLVGDKTPTNTYSLGLLASAFPNAQYLFISRDPKDVVHSYLSMGRYGTATDAAQRWNEAHIAWRKFSSRIRPEQGLEVTYESLVKNTNEVMCKIGDWLEVPQRETYLKEDFFWGDIDQRTHHANVMKEISEKSIGKGAMNLTQPQKNEIFTVLGQSPKGRDLK